MVGAHFDKSDAGDGAADNWAGVSLLPSLYQALRELPLQHSFEFVGFTDEELGLVGSERFVREELGPNQPEIVAMINLDTLGWSFTKYWSARADSELAHLLEVTARDLGFRVRGANFDESFGSDALHFREAGIPTLPIHALNKADIDRMHSWSDTIASVNTGQLVETYRLLVQFLVRLDRWEAPNGPGGAARLEPPAPAAVVDEDRRRPGAGFVGR